MLLATETKGNAECKKGRVRFPGIVEDAQALGVERTHLYRVLTGKRPSESLMRRYQELKSGRAAK